MQGTNKKQEITSIEIDGKMVTDWQLLPDIIANFFKTNISKLTSNQPPINKDLVAGFRKMSPFTIEEIRTAFIQCKPKMSKGVDNIPMKVLKMVAIDSITLIHRLFKEINEVGIPDQWKLAKVVPIPKKANVKDISNFRPVSNLCSLSKVYERCVLNRLMKTPSFNELIGSHQHGFRKFHSTTTCAMELRDSISKFLDNKEKVLVYSLDLSAAFDMLRLDTFHAMLKDDIPEDLMGFFMDFLKDRRYLVNVEGIDSNVVHIDRGCPQGSVLGPILFSMYVRKAMQKLPERCKYLSYADDSYVIIHERSIEEAKQVLEEVIVSHISELTEIGMVVNKSKTEIVHFRSPKEIHIVNDVMVSGVEVKTVDSMKVLGLLFDPNLTWKMHIDQLCNKLPPLINGI